MALTESEPDKRRSVSPEWRREYNAAYYRTNSERLKAAAADWRKANVDRARSNTAAWAKANPDRAKASSAAWYEANKGRVKAAATAWLKAHPDRARAISSTWNRSAKAKAAGEAYRKANSHRLNRNKKEWRKANPDLVKASNVKIRLRYRNAKAANGGSFSGPEWRALVESFGGKCVCCGAMPKTLAADHVVPVSIGGSNNIANIQPLCKSCNRAKSAKTIDYRDTPFTRTGKLSAA